MKRLMRPRASKTRTKLARRSSISNGTLQDSDVNVAGKDVDHLWIAPIESAADIKALERLMKSYKTAKSVRLVVQGDLGTGLNTKTSEDLCRHLMAFCGSVRFTCSRSNVMATGDLLRPLRTSMPDLWKNVAKVVAKNTVGRAPPGIHLPHLSGVGGPNWKTLDALYRVAFGEPLSAVGVPPASVDAAEAYVLECRKGADGKKLADIRVACGQTRRDQVTGLAQMLSGLSRLFPSYCRADRVLLSNSPELLSCDNPLSPAHSLYLEVLSFMEKHPAVPLTPLYDLTALGALLEPDCFETTYSHPDSGRQSVRLLPDAGLASRLLGSPRPLKKGSVLVVTHDTGPHDTDDAAAVAMVDHLMGAGYERVELLAVGETHACRTSAADRVKALDNLMCR